jgi:hypothetical protein
MAIINKVYPHVNITTTAIVRPEPFTEDDSATALFVQFKAKKGLSDAIQPIYTLSQFTSEYGQADFDYQGRTILNIYNWLSAGGRIYALRLVGATGAVATGRFPAAAEEGQPAIVNYLEIKAKNKGVYYNSPNLQLTLSDSIYSTDSTTFIDARVTLDSATVLTIYKLESLDDLEKKLIATPYFGSIELKGTYTFASLQTAVESANVVINNFTGGLDSSESLDSLVEDFFTNITVGEFSASSTIANKLEYPIDLILDAGLSQETKQAIADFTSELPISDKAYSNKRPDIVVLFDQYDFSTDVKNGEVDAITSTSINHAIYTQKLSIAEVITGKDIWVTPTYFLASLIPVNDRIYGIQWPTAGLTRGVLQGVKSISKNPTEQEKQDFYKSKQNYIEKDSRGFYFMSQLTSESENTALRFLNNVRVTNRMIRELENLGRDYLFEFNDSATLNNMRNALTRYVNGWIQNRTLNFGTVTVEPDQFFDERVSVGLNIRFTGTIEIISIDITIE